MLSTLLGFNLPLSLINPCYTAKKIPPAFDLAKVVAICKDNGKDTGDPDNYRPNALLQLCYKFYEILLLN